MKRLNEMKWTIVYIYGEEKAACYKDDGIVLNLQQPLGAVDVDDYINLIQELKSVETKVIKVKRFGAVTVLRCREI